MKHIKILTACLGLLAGFASTASGATNGVVVGQNFQSVIDASAPGDTLVVQPGIYPDASLVFNKPLTVLALGGSGQMMTFLGAIQVTGAGASSFQNALFSGRVQTTGAAVSFFDSTFNSNVTVTAGAVTMKRTTLNYPLTLSSNAAMVALRMNAYATVTATATAGSGTSFLVVQSWFASTVTLSGYTAWLGYNNFSFDVGYAPPNLQETNCNSVLIGNKFWNQGEQRSTAYVIYESRTPDIASCKMSVFFSGGLPDCVMQA